MWLLIPAFALACACSDASFRVVTGPSDAYDLFVADGAIIARSPGGLSAVRVSGSSATNTPLQSLELGGGARLNLPQRAFIAESGATVPLTWLDDRSVAGTRVRETCVVAYDSGSADVPTHELKFVSCKDGRLITSTAADLRTVDLIALDTNALLVARRGDGVTRLEVLDAETGQARWSHESRPGTGDPIVVGDEAFVVSGDDRLIAFRLQDGNQREMTLRLPDGYSISAIGPVDRPGHFAMASCLCVQAGAVVESRVSLVSAKDATTKRLAKLPKAFAALDVVIRGKSILVVGYTNSPSKPMPSDLDLAPK